MTSTSEDHIKFLRIALTEAAKCEPTQTAYCVGCVLVARWPSENSEPVILATGYSRELPGNTHAEANALSKARAILPANLYPVACQPNKDITLEDILSHVDVYTTMEPCSVRTSGLPACADALVAAKVRRCFIGVGEPADFVKCEGAQRLKDAGIEVVWIQGLENECLAAARKGRNMNTKC